MKWGNLLIVIGALLAAFAGVWVQRQVARTVPESIAATTLEISLPDSHGQMQSIAQWRGKIVVVNFWATWCPPCLHEIPEFIRLQRQYANQGLQFVGIAIDSRQAVSELMKTLDINYPLLIAEESGMELSRQLGNVIGAVPYSVILDRQGRPVYRHPGELPASKIEQWLHDLNAAQK